MSRHAFVGLALAASGLMASVSSAAAPVCGATVPVQCSAPRDSQGYKAGVFQGMSTVLQIWSSAAVGQNPANWGVLKTQVTQTIPTIVETLRKSSQWSNYTLCRVQGLLDGTVCEMNTLNPNAQCQLDGVDWGKISSAIYCELSIALGGLGDVTPWFISNPQSSCEANFETFCAGTYRYAATAGKQALSADLIALLKFQNIDPVTLQLSPACLQYTDYVADAGAGVPVDAGFATTFVNSIAVDCAYSIPTPP